MSLVVDSPRKCRRGFSPTAQLTVALVLITFGALLFLDNIGILHIQRLYDYWPAILIVFGGVKLIRKPSLVGVLWSLFLIGAGSLFLLVNLDILHIRHDDTWPLSLLFITFGFLALIKSLDRRPVGWRRTQRPDSNVAVSADVLNESVTLGNVERRIESRNFQGGELHNIMGSMEIDLRRAQLPPGWSSATLFIECVMANTEIRVPDAWRVVVQVKPVLGNFENRTLPPRIESGSEPPTLIVTGTSVLSNVELDN